jgi:hypothetical protein
MSAYVVFTREETFDKHELAAYSSACGSGSIILYVPEQPVDHQASLRILIEKDFACIDGTDEQNADTFPNPLIEEGNLSEISAEPRFSP